MNNDSKLVHEYDVVQNIAIGAIAIFNFANEFYKKTGELRGPSIALCMLVLPLIFNKTFVSNAHRRAFNGGLYKVINEDKSMFAGLQDRVEKMHSVSIRSLNLGFTSKLLTMDQENFEILPVRSKSPEFNNNEIKEMISTSRRLGQWFSQPSFQELCTLLKVRF